MKPTEDRLNSPYRSCTSVRCVLVRLPGVALVVLGLLAAPTATKANYPSSGNQGDYPICPTCGNQEGTASSGEFGSFASGGAAGNPQGEVGLFSGASSGAEMGLFSGGSSQAEIGLFSGGAEAVCPVMTKNPIFLYYGSVVERAVDLSLPGPTRSWNQIRSYHSKLTGATKFNGKWFSHNGDLHLYREQNGDLVVPTSAYTQRLFEKQQDGTYTPPVDSPCTIEFVDGGLYEYDTFLLTNWETGHVSIFYAFNTGDPGKLKERTTLYWMEADRSGYTYSYNSGTGLMEQITTPAGQAYNIAVNIDSGYKLESVAVWTGAVGTSTKLQEVWYTYFDNGNHHDDVGSTGDLVQVKTSIRASDGSYTTRYTQYRYEAQNRLKAVYYSDAVQRIIDADSSISSADDILREEDAHTVTGSYKIKDYASRWFTYHSTNEPTTDLQGDYGGSAFDESDYFVKSETIGGGGCGGCGGGSGGSFKLEYHYVQLNSEQTDVNIVTRLVVEDTKDSADTLVFRRVYGLNSYARLLREVLIEDPGGTPKFWCKSWKFADASTQPRKLHRVKEFRTPAAHNVDSNADAKKFLNPYNGTVWTNDTNTLQDSAGVILDGSYTDDGHITAVMIKKGRTGAAKFVWAVDYGLGTTDDEPKNVILKTHVYPTATNTLAAADRLTTDYQYDFHDTADELVKKWTRKLPAVDTDQNGPDVQATAEVYIDTAGRLRWTKDAEGYIDYYSYHPESGGLAYVARDVNPASLPDSADENSTKWVTSSDGDASNNTPDNRDGGLPTALELLTQTEFDEQGRPLLSRLVDGTESETTLAEHYTRYETDRTIRFPYWDGSECLTPINVTELDDGGTLTETYAIEGDEAETDSFNGTLKLKTSAGQDDYVRWTRNDHDDITGALTKVHRYHDIPTGTTGSKDTNYAETIYGYDSMGRRNRVVAPGGTVTRSVFDKLGRVEQTWIGTDDTGATDDDPDGSGTPNNMKIVSQNEYDDGNDGGNGNLTKITRLLSDLPVDSSDVVTEIKYDWRGRRIATVDPEQYDGKDLYTYRTFDHMGQATKTERYYHDGQGTIPDPSGDRLLARRETFFDKLGRAWKTVTTEVDPTDGTTGNTLSGYTWYDKGGSVIKRHAAGSERFVKTQHDALGRVTNTYVGYDTDEPIAASGTFAQAGTVDGDTIFEQGETTYLCPCQLAGGDFFGRLRRALSRGTGRCSFSHSWLAA